MPEMKECLNKLNGADFNLRFSPISQILKPLMANSLKCQFEWLRTGEEALREMLRAIQEAKVSVRFEMYIFEDSPIGRAFREALTGACQRGVRVQILIDTLGSVTLPESFWDTYRKAGGEFRWFNPLKLNRWIFRDHRKILVCDDQIAFIGGFNVAEEYQGDGVKKGWRDLGMKISGQLVQELSLAFDEM